MRTLRRGRLVRSTVLVIALALAVTACSDDGGGGDDDAAASTTTTAGDTPTTVAPGTGAAPQETLAGAVEAFLTAQVDLDAEASYRLLGGEAVDAYRDVAEWSVRLSQLAPPTGFEIEGGGTDEEVTAVVTHEPGLDPFIGLAAGRERQTFVGIEVDGGWLIGAEPEVELLLPPDEDAPDAVQAWAAAVQSCDEAAADALQGIDVIFGESVGAGELCESTGAVETGPAEQLLGGPESADLVAQYSTDAIGWARSVPVTAPTTPFFVIVAPIGDTWKVIGVYD